MLNAQFDGDVLVLRPDGPIGRADIATLTKTVDDYLAGHPRVAGVMVETASFPGYAELAAFADHVRFVAEHRARVRRVALVTDSALAPVAQFFANHVVGIEMRHYPPAEREAALAWLRSP
jgi:hypothetical protein